MSGRNLASIVNKPRAAYAMQLLRIEEDEILLRSTLFTLDVFANKGGVTIVHFNATKSP